MLIGWQRWSSNLCNIVEDTRWIEKQTRWCWAKAQDCLFSYSNGNGAAIILGQPRRYSQSTRSLTSEVQMVRNGVARSRKEQLLRGSGRQFRRNKRRKLRKCKHRKTVVWSSDLKNTISWLTPVSVRRERAQLREPTVFWSQWWSLWVSFHHWSELVTQSAVLFNYFFSFYSTLLFTATSRSLMSLDSLSVK